MKVEFQFHYGTIKSIRGIYVLANVRDFNSTMVRLKADMTQTDSVRNEFQFHYGTIKRTQLTRRLNVAGLFQFHYGTIKRRR